MFKIAKTLIRHFKYFIVKIMLIKLFNGYFHFIKQINQVVENRKKPTKRGQILLLFDYLLLFYFFYFSARIFVYGLAVYQGWSAYFRFDLLAASSEFHKTF